MTLGDILAAWNLLDKAQKLWTSLRGRRPADTLPHRFFRIFTSSGVHPNQIPRFFDHGLTLKDVQDEQSVLPKLDEAILDDVCRMFGIRREWLDGAENLIYPCHDFYKKPDAFAQFILELKAANPNDSLDGVLIAPIEQNGPALLILTEEIGWVGEKAIYRYHLCNNWEFSYWKSRAYLTAAVAIASKHSVHVRGKLLPAKTIECIASGEKLLGENIDDLPLASGRLWYPEDLALKPETYLHGIDPELMGFGLKASLEAWLELHQAGYMETGISVYQPDQIRAAFAQHLEGIAHKDTKKSVAFVE